MTVRYPGFDALRGVCAAGVALYHVLYWSAAADYAIWGRYFVNFFFVVSGASIYSGYAARIAAGYPLTRYCIARYARIVPLFLAALTVQIFFVALGGNADRDLLLKGILNVSLLFGFAAPGATSLLDGGWTLGVEFVFYLLFPLIPLALGARRLVPAMCVALALQVAFVSFLAPRDLITDDNWSLYASPAAFGFYFICGCYIGERLRQPAALRPAWSSLLAVTSFLGFAALGVVAADHPHVTGLTGAALSCLVGVSVYCWGRMSMQGTLRTLAALSGSASYGVYLLHPIVHAVLQRTVWTPTTSVLARVASLLPLTFALALVIDRFFEKPLRRAIQSRFAGRMAVPEPVP